MGLTRFSEATLEPSEKEPSGPAEDDGIDEQAVLVDQARRDEGVADGDAAGDGRGRRHAAALLGERDELVVERQYVGERPGEGVVEHGFDTGLQVCGVGQGALDVEALEPVWQTV